MIEKIILDAILDDTFKTKIESVERNCLRIKNERDKCKKCAKLCPEEAISLTEDGVYVDPILCTGCNLCVSNCYSRNFSAKNRPYLAAVNEFINEKNSLWQCKRTISERGINFGCLNAIDPRFLFAIGYSDFLHNLTLDLSACENCEYKNIGTDIEKTVAFIEENAELENLKFEIKKEEIPTEDFSRRDFFKSIIEDSKKMTKNKIKDTTKFFGLDLETAENIDAFIKIFLKSGISKNRNTEWMKNFIFSLSANENCTFCYECINACPTGALKIEDIGNEKILVLDNELCNFCKRCIEKCKYGVFDRIKFEKMIKYNLNRKQKSKCRGCGVFTTEINEDGYCMTCAIRNKNRKKL